jgi:hypothetical protein
MLSALTKDRVRGRVRMVRETPWQELAEQVVFARTINDDEARGVLEWVASREGKSLSQLVEELRQHSGAQLV